jgi:multicomponent Na+:H+ antiporter subunit C
MLNLFTAFAIGLMFALGIFQLLRRNLIRVAIGLVILTNAVNMFLLTTGAYDGLVAAYYGNMAGQQISDPLPQALVLTAIVIGVGFFAFSLSLLYVIGLRYKTSDSDRVEGLRY